MVEGRNQTGRNNDITKYQGQTVHLIASSNEVADSDTQTELNNKSQASLSTTDSDWTISHDNTAGTTTLENANELNFGSQSGYTHTQTVIESSGTDEFIIALESSSNNFTGEEFRYDANQLSVTVGGE